jgi:RIO kinase 1
LNLNDFDQYEDYEALFDPMNSDRKARRKRKPKAHHVAKRDRHEVITDITADTDSAESGFKTTYTPQLFEQGWLIDSLRPFFDRGLITDVLARVQGGKEANVYRCEASQETGFRLLAAKVYRPRMFRNLRNDKMYREGRELLTADGKHGKPDDRMIRAVGKKTAFGQQVSHTSWLMYEYSTLETLFEAGAAVPKPISSAENALLMSFCGDENLAAPRLNEVSLETNEAVVLFREVIHNIELMLENGFIHGDLSAYNILYWDGMITLIDFPQVTQSRGNAHAREILQRDITRVCEYFSDQGVRCDDEQIMRRLWKRYVELDAKLQAADLSVLLEAQPEHD